MKAHNMNLEWNTTTSWVQIFSPPANYQISLIRNDYGKVLERGFKRIFDTTRGDRITIEMRRSSFGRRVRSPEILIRYLVHSTVTVLSLSFKILTDLEMSADCIHWMMVTWLSTKNLAKSVYDAKITSLMCHSESSMTNMLFMGILWQQIWRDS